MRYGVLDLLWVVFLFLAIVFLLRSTRMDRMVTMSAYELRRHLLQAHDTATRGLMYDEMLVLHNNAHRSSAGQDHDHADGPGSDRWTAECVEFGCDG